ncbi:MAG: choice-of-anchor Q domain-containing protein [Pseudomonadota bacterium]
MAQFIVTTTLDEADGSVVDGDVSLRDAIAAANATAEADEIIFASGVGEAFENGGTIRLTLGTLDLTSDITINGDIGDDLTPDVTITGDAGNNDLLTTDSSGNAITDVANNANFADNVRVFESTADVTLDGLVITGGAANDQPGFSIESGGGVNAISGSLTILASSVSGNRAADFGGAVRMDTSASNLTILDSEVFGNGARAGHGVSVSSTGTSDVHRSLIAENTYANGLSGYGSGGLGFYGSETVSITDSTVRDNVAGFGAIRVFGTDLIATNLTVADNSANNANANGGGLELDTAATVDIDGSSFTGNYAGRAGGAIFSPGFLTLTNSTIDVNSASASGGGIASYGSFYIGGSTLSGNSTTGLNGFSTSRGGGLFTQGNSVTPNVGTIVNSTVHGNTAEDGAGLYLGSFSYGEQTLINTTVTSNVASDQGGGIRSSGPTNILNSIVLGNSAARDVEVFTTFAPSLNVQQSIISGSVGDVFASLVGSGGALADNGGLVETVALLNSAVNPALDIATPTIFGGTDAAGQPRVVDVAGVDNGGTIDAGAFELQSGTSVAVDPASLVVTTALDVVDSTDGLTSLREAVFAANSSPDASTITFAAGLNGSTLMLGGEQLRLMTSMTISGDTNGDGIADITIDGNNASRIFAVQSGSVVLSALNLTGGNISGFQSGGAVSLFRGASLQIEHSTISGNSAPWGGGVSSDGSLTVTYSTIANNTATYGGGGLSTAQDTLIRNSTIADNTVLTPATNAASANGGGINNFGELTLVNSTVTGNSATANGGGIASVYSSPTLSITNSLILGNGAPNADEVFGTYTDNGGNLIGGSTAALVFATTQTVDPDGTPASGDEFSAGVLGINGGTVQTVALRDDVTNPALDRGLYIDNVPTDAAGQPRTVDNPGVDNGGFVDAGAFENQTGTVVVRETPSLIVDTVSEVENAFDGVTSLREALALAQSDPDASTISFAANMNGQTIVLTSGIVNLTTDVTIDGDINDDGIADVTLDANGAHRVVEVSGAGTDVLLDGLTLRGGYISGFEVGGGVLFTGDGSGTIRNSVITGTTGTGTAPRGGGVAIEAGSTVAIEGTTISQNDITGNGGGIYQFTGSTLMLTGSTISGNDSGRFGGGADLRGMATVTDTTFSDNQAILGGGVFSRSGTLDFDRTTIEGNTASGGGGARLEGGSNSTFTNTTFHGNIAGAGGGGLHTTLATSATVENSTFTANAAQTAGGGLYSGTSTTLTNTIIVGNRVNATPNEVSGTYTDGGGNLISSDAALLFDQTVTVGSITSGVLAANGGAVETVALLADEDNPAIDASVGATIPGVDARNVAALDFAGVGIDGAVPGVRDAGAFEVNPGPLAVGPEITSLATASVTENSTFVIDVNATDDLDSEGSGLSYALTSEGGGGVDNAFFSIDATTGIAQFIVAPDFEDPDDADDNNVYELQVTVTDSIGKTAVQNISATVTDVNDFTRFVVDTLVDEDDGDFSAGDFSLREALRLASINNRGDLITFDPSLAGGAITASGTYLGAILYATGDLTIDGDIVGDDNRADITIDGNQQSRVFDTRFGGVDVVVDALTITGGRFGNGAGVSSALGSNLTIRNSTITGNESPTLPVFGSLPGGAAFVGAGSSLSLYNTTISNNTSVATAGGVYVQNGGTLTMVNSTVANNSAVGSGGGLMNLGTATVIQSTFTGNSSAASGGGVYAGAALSLINSVVAGNSDTSGLNDTVGFVANTGSITTGTAADLFAAVDPLTGGGQLADNGGPVQTVALRLAGPGIDSGVIGSLTADQQDLDGDEDVAETLPIDSNGGARVQGAAPDAGAYEAIQILGDGADNSLLGDAASELILGFNGVDSVNAGGGNDLVLAGEGADVVLGGTGNDTLEGEAGNDALGGGDDSDLLRGGIGNDFLSGGLGVDTLEGGEGDDVYALVDAVDVIIEAPGEGYDRANASVSVTLADNVDAGNLLGSDDLSMTAATTGSWLNGNSGNNTLTGQQGNDRMDGNAGMDTLDGGLGNDILEGGSDADIFVLSAGSDIILDFEDGVDQIDLTGSGTLFQDLTLLDTGTSVRISHGTGSLTLQNFDLIDLTASDFQEPATSSPPVIEGTSGDDNLTQTFGPLQLRGLGGNDLLRVFIGSATLEGGSGDDRYYVYETGTVINELADEGFDRVYTRVDLTLSENIEFGATNGAGDIDITGNALGNQITGNADANLLSGLDGNDRLRGQAGTDTIDGGGGNDILEGGADADRFVFETGDGTDLILDFETGVDVIDFTGTALTFGDLTIVDSGMDALVLYGSDVIRLTDTTAAEMDVNQFLFTGLE